MKLKYTLAACSDCIAFVANGDIPEERPNIAEEIADHLGQDAAGHLVNANGLDESGEYYRDADDNPINPDHPDYECQSEDWFSWSPCECCGSTLGGNRNRLAVLGPDLRDGTRVRLARDVDIYPLNIYRAGLTGTVVDVSADPDDPVLFHVQLDAIFPELAEWNNRLQVFNPARPDAGDCVPDCFALI